MIRNATTSPVQVNRTQTVCVPMSQRNVSAGSVPLYQHVSSTAHLSHAKLNSRWPHANSDVTCPSFLDAYGTMLHMRERSVVPKM
jgi:hypothetical protein